MFDVFFSNKRYFLIFHQSVRSSLEILVECSRCIKFGYRKRAGYVQSLNRIEEINNGASAMGATVSVVDLGWT